MAQKKQNQNLFVRIMMILLCVFIGTLVTYNSFSSSKVQITWEVLILICFLIALVLSETFDNFSIFNFITFSRNKITLDAADEQDIEKQREDDDVLECEKKIPFSKLREVALKKFLDKERIDTSTLKYDVKLVEHFKKIDQISEYTPIFDAYSSKDNDREVFIELKPKQSLSQLRDKLYFLLSKINSYNTIKKSNAYLHLVIVLRPEEVAAYEYINSIFDEFKPAKDRDLLKITPISISEKEYSKIVIN